MFKIVNSDITLDLRCDPSDYVPSASEESKSIVIITCISNAM